jgi:hypothetical protein
VTREQARVLALVLLVPTSAFAALALAHDLFTGFSPDPGEEPTSVGDIGLGYAVWIGLPIVGWVLFRLQHYRIAAAAVAIPFVWAAAAVVLVATL